MTQLTYRDLVRGEAPLLGTIDRSERIDGVYRVKNGALVLEPFREDAPTWSGSVLAKYVRRLQALLDAGGRVVAAWDGPKLLGLASLDLAGVGGDPAVVQLDMLYVSAESRGRGIGRALTERVIELARSRGAATLYVSATPSKGTVDAYLRLGAELATTPDPELFAQEPEDVHLSIDLR